jgi:formyl-CoA transferase
MKGPLDGLSILAAEQMHALPYATQLLALMGADVIKVEPLAGDAGRFGHPAVREPDGAESGMTFVRNNLEKRSIGLDLKTDRGRQIFLELAKTVDAVVENFRPGTVDKLGIHWDAVHVANPKAVYLSISGFGNQREPASPYREWAAYAPIVEGMAGLYEYSRDGEAPPRMAIAGALGDTGPGLYAVIGLLAALHERERTGVGCYVDVAMYDAMIAIADVVNPSSLGADPARILDGIGILHAFRARDGWFTVEVVREPHFPQFAEAVGHPEWIDDPRLSTRAGWSSHMEEVIRPGVEAWAAERSPLEAASLLAAAGVAAGPVNDAAAIRADEHVRERGLIHEYENLDSSTPTAVVGNPIAFRHRSDEPSPPSRKPARWPQHASDTEQIIKTRLGFDEAAIQALRTEGVIP